MASQNMTSGSGIRQLSQPGQMAPPSDQQIANLLLKKAEVEVQQIYSNQIQPQVQNQLDIPPQPVGILTRLWVIVQATANNTSGANTATLTDNGIANLLSRVRFYDTNNLLRHDTNGLHLSHVAAAKRRHPFSASGDWNVSNGNNLSGLFNVNPASWGILQAPATIAHGASGTVRAIFEVPIAAAADDLRGAIFVQSVNATMNLHLEVNQNAFADTTTTPTLDPTFAVYSGASGTLTNCQVTVIQEFLDQLPRDAKSGAYILPNKALSIAYMLNNATLGGVVQNADFSIPYINFRSYLSSFLIYNNNGYTRTFGTDINYLREIAANFAPYFQYDPLFAAYKAREVFVNDLPAGTYYINHRHNPIYTTQSGNRQIQINPSTVAAGAYVNWMSEFFANQNVLQGAGSAL